jgi:lipooligosaccharide transport system permease protein
MHLWHVQIGSMLVEPLVVLLALGFGLGSFVGKIEGLPYENWVTPGIVASYAMFHAAFETTFGTYMRMETRRVYDGIIVTPVGVDDLALGEIVWGGTRSTIATVPLLGIAVALGLVSSPWAIAVVPVAFLVGLLFASLSLTYTAIVPSINVLSTFFTMFIVPMFYVSGVFFPISRLPHWLEYFSWALPLTPCAHFIRGLMTGELGWSHLGSFALLSTWIAVLIPSAIFLLRRRIIK